MNIETTLIEERETHLSSSNTEINLDMISIERIQKSWIAKDIWVENWFLRCFTLNLKKTFKFKIGYRVLTSISTFETKFESIQWYFNINWLSSYTFNSWLLLTLYCTLYYSCLSFGNLLTHIMFMPEPSFQQSIRTSTLTCSLYPCFENNLYFENYLYIGRN